MANAIVEEATATFFLVGSDCSVAEGIVTWNLVASSEEEMDVAEGYNAIVHRQTAAAQWVEEEEVEEDFVF